MKQNALMTLMIAFSLLSCNNQTKSDDINSDNVMPESEFAVKREAPASVDTAAIQPILKSMDNANTMIYNYHHYRKHILREEIVSTGFQLDAAALRAYLADTSVKTLNVYLAKRKDANLDPVDSTMTLVYIGAFDSLSADKKTTYKVERPFIKGGESYLLDQAMPCPTCADRIRVYNLEPADKNK